MNRTENAGRLLSDYLKQSACQAPHRTAFVYNDQRISYREFNEKVETLAKYLLQLGVKRQDKVAYLMETQPEFFYLIMAASRIGAIVVGLSTKLTPHELQYMLANAEAAYVFVSGGDKPYVDRISSILPACHSVRQVIVIGDQDFSKFSRWEEIFWKDIDPSMDTLLMAREAQVQSDDVLLMLYTSGTTGKPKGAMLSHRNIIHACLVEVAEFKSTPADVWLNSMPVNHVGGAVVQGIAPLLSLSTVVLLPYFSPTKVLKLIQSEKVSILGGVPTMYAMELSLPDYDAYDKSSIRIAHFGGSMPSQPLLAKVAETMTPHVYNCLGMTEVAGIVTYTSPDGDPALLSKSLGKVIPEAEWKLVNKEREPVPQGQVGELALRGSTIFKGYYKLPRETADCIDADGWFYSGDLFFENENGLLILMGRKKEMFITGGENVYACEVESVIASYENVNAVALLPISDPIYGEVGCAYISPKSGSSIDETDLKEFLKSKLARFKIPVKYIFRTDLPLTPSGKVAKKVLRQEATAGESHQPASF